MLHYTPFDVLGLKMSDTVVSKDISQEALQEKLRVLQIEHRDLDDVIERLINCGVAFDQLQLQRLKKRKLILKDQIIQIESDILPDIIA